MMLLPVLIGLLLMLIYIQINKVNIGTLLAQLSFNFLTEMKLPKGMDPEKYALIITLQRLEHSIRDGDKTKIKKIINGFHENLERNKLLLSELYNSRTRCTTDTDLILAACKNKKADILNYIIKDADILDHLTDPSFNDTEVNKQRTEAIKQALGLQDFTKVEMLYNFWCGNLHWSGHDMKNIEMIGNVLRKASDACLDCNDKLQANFHCLLTFNAFQRKLYAELAGSNPSDITPKTMATILLKVLRIHDEYSHIEKIRRKHTQQEWEQAMEANINDSSSTFYKNLEYIYYEVYYRKLDFNVALLILENLFVIRTHLKTRFNKTEGYFNVNPNMRSLYKNAANMYEEIESEIYHFIYRTNEDWRLYLPKNRRITIENHIVTHEGRKKNVELSLDLYKIYNGPVICVERESFKESFEKLKIILKEYVISDDPDINNNNTNNNSKVYLLNENYLQTVSFMRDHFSLIKMIYYIEAIEKRKGFNVFMVERVVQVVGEMLKSTDECRHLSRSTQALLQTTISVETSKHLQKIRDFMAHDRKGELRSRIDMEKTQADRFKKIKEELIKIKQIINPILDICKAILDKSLLEKGLRLLEQRIQSLPDEANYLVEDMYRLYKIHLNELVQESGDFYQGFWRHTDFTLQLLQEIPWIMQNRARILTDIQLAKRGLSDKIDRILPSLITNGRKMLEHIIQNNKYIKIINQYDKSVQMTDCPDQEEINETQKQVKKLMKRNKSLKVDQGVLNEIKNYKEHWESVKGMLSFCFTECELFAPLKVSLTDDTSSFINAYNILAEMEVIGVMHRSNLASLAGRRAVVFCLRKYRKCEDWVGNLYGLKPNEIQFAEIKTLHDQFESKIKTSDPRLAREVLISCLNSRLILLKQILLYPQQTLHKLVQSFVHDVEFRLTIEIVLADIANVFGDCIRIGKDKPNLMSKSSKLLRAINLGNVLDHGNPFLEVIGDIFNSYDLAAEWLKKALMFAEDAASIEALYELFKGKMDYRTIKAGDLLQMDAQQKQLFAQFIKSPQREYYEYLTRYPIPSSQRPRI